MNEIVEKCLLFRKQNVNECELRFRGFMNITKSEFTNTLDTIKKSVPLKTTNSSYTNVLFEGDIRRTIYPDNSIATISKKCKNSFIFNDYNLKLSNNIEKQLNDIQITSVPILTRDIQRVSLEFDNYTVEFTTVIVDKVVTYEIEIEIQKTIKKVQLRNVIINVLLCLQSSLANNKKIMTVPEIKNITNQINFKLPLPFTINPTHFPILSSEWKFTLKADGLRVLVYIPKGSSDVYTITRKKKLGVFVAKITPQRDDVILDGELISNKKILIFDCISVFGQNFSKGHNLESRIDACNAILSSLNTNLIKFKPYFDIPVETSEITSKDIENSEGIILTLKNGNYFDTSLKWKNNNTIDLFIDNSGNIFVTGKHGKHIIFRTFSKLCSSNLNILQQNNDTNQIIECDYEFLTGKSEDYSVRVDKETPNYIDIAEEIFQLILEPVTSIPVIHQLSDYYSDLTSILDFTNDAVLWDLSNELTVYHCVKNMSENVDHFAFKDERIKCQLVFFDIRMKYFTFFGKSVIKPLTAIYLGLLDIQRFVPLLEMLDISSNCEIKLDRECIDLQTIQKMAEFNWIYQKNGIFLRKTQIQISVYDCPALTNIDIKLFNLEYPQRIYAQKVDICKLGEFLFFDNNSKTIQELCNNAGLNLIVFENGQIIKEKGINVSNSNLTYVVADDVLLSIKSENEESHLFSFKKKGILEDNDM